MNDYTYNEKEAIDRAADVLTEASWAESCYDRTGEKEAMEGLLRRLFRLPSLSDIERSLRDTIREEFAGMTPSYIPGTTTLKDEDFLRVLRAAWKHDRTNIPSTKLLEAILKRNQERLKQEMSPIEFSSLVSKGRCYSLPEAFENFLHYEGLLDRFVAFNQNAPGELQVARILFLQDIQKHDDERDVVFIEENGTITEIIYW